MPYSNGNFVLEDVSLSAGDNWFAIEITQDMITDYSDEMSGTFTVQNGSTTLTITVKAYAATDTDNELTNDATSGTLYLEGLTAGKYYIKITANEKCTVTLNMAIAV